MEKKETEMSAYHFHESFNISFAPRLESSPSIISEM